MLCSYPRVFPVYLDSDFSPIECKPDEPPLTEQNKVIFSYFTSQKELFLGLKERSVCQDRDDYMTFSNSKTNTFSFGSVEYLMLYVIVVINE